MSYEKLHHLSVDDEPRPLGYVELSAFTESNVWAAARLVWGEDFADPETFRTRQEITPETSDVWASLEDPPRVYFRMSAEELELASPDGSVEENAGPPEQLVSISLELYSPNATKFFRDRTIYDKNGDSEELEVWELNTYDFYLDRETPPIADSRYVVKPCGDTEELEDADLTKHQAKVMKRLSRKDKFCLERGIDMDTQDILDVHNVLLALGVPEKVISPVA